MKKSVITAIVSFCLTAMLAPGCALGDLIFNGEVTANDTHVITAPFGSNVGSIDVRAGDTVRIGDALMEMETNRVYAPVDGRVSAVFGETGDYAETIKTLYKALVFIEPMNRFIVSDCSTDKAYNASENLYIHVGETVYLACTKDKSHKGQGIVVGLDEKDDSVYQILVTGGEFYMYETVNIYRDENRGIASRIGQGTINRNAPIAVNGEGSVLRMHVKPGDSVERGELLFETVKGNLDGLYAPETTVYSDVSGIIATVDVANGAAVEKGAKLATIYPLDKMQVKMSINESDLPDVRVGGKVSLEFNWDEGAKSFPGEITSISYLNEKVENNKSIDYAAYIDFEPDDTVRMGMSVTVFLKEE